MAENSSDKIESPEPELDMEVIQKVQDELERLLSKENLMTDANIVVSMNEKMFVPCFYLTTLESIQAITTEPKVLIAAAERSDRLAVNEEQTMIQPVIKSKRVTIILRDVPESVDEAQIRELFNSCDKCSDEDIHAIKPDINHTWFVTLSTEEVTLEVALWLRSQKLSGESCKAAIKSEHFALNFFQAPQKQMFPPGVPEPGNFMYSYDGFGRKGRGRGRKAEQQMDIQKRFLTSPEMTALFQNPSNFPPLDSQSKQSLTISSYNHKFRQYSKSEIISLCDQMSKVECTIDIKEVTVAEPRRDWAPPVTPGLSPKKSREEPAPAAPAEEEISKKKKKKKKAGKQSWTQEEWKRYSAWEEQQSGSKSGNLEGQGMKWVKKDSSPEEKEAPEKKKMSRKERNVKKGEKEAAAAKAPKTNPEKEMQKSPRRTKVWKPKMSDASLSGEKA